MSDLIIDRLKEIVKLQNIKSYELDYKYSWPITFLRDIHERYLSLKDVDNEQSKFANELR